MTPYGVNTLSNHGVQHLQCSQSWMSPVTFNLPPELAVTGLEEFSPPDQYLPIWPHTATLASPSIPTNLAEAKHPAKGVRDRHIVLSLICLHPPSSPSSLPAMLLLVPQASHLAVLTSAVTASWDPHRRAEPQGDQASC